LLGALIFTFASTLLAIYVPFLNGAFGFTRVPVMEAAIAIGIALMLIPIVEVIKFFQRK
jgi:Ca2+-transporting ATPase